MSIQKGDTPLLFPMEPALFLDAIRMLVAEEINKAGYKQQEGGTVSRPAALTEKPLLKIREICTLFSVSRPTVYQWVRFGKLKPYKIRSRVYFLYSDVQQLLQ
jgi:excisionase family DNA binding protein